MVIFEQTQTGFFSNLMGSSAGSVIVTILATILLFGALIFIHELGHYLTARLFHVTIKEFAIGMGPKVIRHTSKKTGILYSFRAFPIGGFVAMEGENEASEDPNAFGRKKVWQRMIITAAGGAMNLLLGLILTFAYVLTMQTHIGTTVTSFPEGAFSARSEQALEVGDEIRKINGSSVRVGQEVIYELFRAGGDPDRRYTNESEDRILAKVDLLVIRNGEELLLKDVDFPVSSEDGLFFALRDFNMNDEGKSFSTTMLNTVRQMRLSVKTVYESLFDLIRGRYGLKQLSGPVGTASVVGEAIKSDASSETQGSRNSFLYLCMIITVNLGLFNLLPLPALDGGRLFFQFIELIFRKPVPVKIEGTIHTVGLLLLLLLMAVVTFKDVFGLFK